MSNNQTLYDCEMVQDLLPLYLDNACSNSSKKIVEEHLKECSNCSTVFEKLKDTNIDDHLIEEKNSVLTMHAKKEKRRAATVGICTAGVLLIPIVVCLICNLAIGHGLDWFFIVLTSLMMVASITVVPLVVIERKASWSIGCFTASLILLLLTCCLYTGGDWFFVAIIPILFGLSVVFLPIVLYQLPRKGLLVNNKGLIAMAANTILLYAIIIASGLYAGSEDYWFSAFAITTFCTAFVWILFLIIRYIRNNACVKCGLCMIISGIFIAVVHDVI
ncbi:zf-HC2 domain-containing protein [Anaerosporobacter sp.]|uniref:zf-HC2 domain-containing protein n=1 Tax=Anaerosporobacter sp. TaxID=1872529 RepID=UPI00286F9295|nr:zf-HC2 domain-containing protein [Anaerosporobacter sp.]